jgi:hypothetical protein
VRTLRQLLLPADQRQKIFKVGSRTFDPDAIGFVDAGASTLDTSLPGNANGGHDGPRYGSDVFADESEAAGGDPGISEDALSVDAQATAFDL